MKVKLLMIGLAMGLIVLLIAFIVLGNISITGGDNKLLSKQKKVTCDVKINSPLIGTGKIQSVKCSAQEVTICLSFNFVPMSLFKNEGTIQFVTATKSTSKT